MRNISAASLEKLSQKTGTEPMILLAVSWIEGQNPILYAEKALPDFNIEGRIITSGNIDDITSVSQNGTSQSFTVTLDDSDGVLKSYLDNVDFHRRPVSVYQWFEGIPLDDTFLIFYGLISTPIVWKEGERTLSFTVLSKTEGLEVGFTPEQGSFTYLPINMVGKMWPLIFGYVMKLPILCIDAIPTNAKQNKGSSATPVTKTPTGIEDPTLQKQITKMTNERNLASDLSKAYFKNYLYASETARANGEIGEDDFVSVGQGTFSKMAQQFQDEGNKMVAMVATLNKKINALNKTLSGQKKLKAKQIEVTHGDKLPQNTTLSVTLNGAVHTGYFTNTTFHVTSAVHPNESLYTDFQIPPSTITKPAQTEPILNRDSFFWADASTQFGVPFAINQDPTKGGYPIRYIVSGGMFVFVYAVYAYRTVNSIKQLYPVPGNYYTQFSTFFGILPVTLIQLPQALSAKMDDKGNSDGWEDELYVTCISFTSSNTVLQMIYIIQNFTDMAYDSVSFNNVATLIANFPSNFALTSQMDAIQLLQDMAYQARCMLYTKNNTFYIAYLATENPSTDTITEADILHQSLEITTTETENISTRFIAKWRADYLPADTYEIIYRFNINRYQLISKTVDFYIYNYQYTVALSATFWLIRESNIFKKVTFKTPIHKLNIETMDFITLNLNIFAEPVIGRVESAVFDPNDYTMSFTVWVPVLLGTNTKYIYAFPSDTTVTNSFPTQANISSGQAPSSNVSLPIDQALPDSVKAPFSGDPGEVPAIQLPGIQTWGAPVQNISKPPVVPPISPAVDSTSIQQKGRPTDLDKYQYDRGKGIVAKQFLPELGVIPAIVESKDDDGTYTCTLYYKGIKDIGNKQKGIIQMAIDKDDTIPTGTVCFVVRFVWNDTDTLKTKFAYYMQVPVWAGTKPPTP